MENNENFVAEQVTENVEQTTEQTVVEPAKVFSQEELNAAVGKAKARERAKITKQKDSEYGELMEVLEAGTGKNGVKENIEVFRNFYTSKGVKLPQKPTYSDKENEILARAEADDIIRFGYDDVVEEVDRLNALGSNRNKKEDIIFHTLATERLKIERGRELAKLGVTEDVYNGKEFTDFASNFKASTPIADIYKIYASTKPKKEHQTMGSMKSTGTADNGVKDYYSFEEAKKFTKADFDKNPKLFEAVQKSMTKWR